MASAEVALPSTSRARAVSSALAARDLVDLERMGLGGLLHRRLPLLRQLGLYLNDGMVLVVAAPMLVGDRREGRRSPVRHRDGLDGAGAPLLEVDDISWGFPQKSPLTSASTFSREIA